MKRAGFEQVPVNDSELDPSFPWPFSNLRLIPKIFVASQLLPHPLPIVVIFVRLCNTYATAHPIICMQAVSITNSEAFLLTSRLT